ncbi:MAG: efflux RND transporter permease subunit, partial [Pseudomonadota bacterium]|nr:efflux RND transporter permease subunit [Pseudomonadota bacterium]
FDFNGMVRHYYLRDQPWQADIHVQLKHKKDRARSSHEIALHAREILKPLIEGTDIHVTVVEMPPGPPVLQSVVAEIYGPDEATRRQLAEHMTTVFQQADILKDVDNYMAMPYERWHFRVDTEKAVRRGISVDTINQNLIMAMDTFKVGDVKRGHVLEPTYIVIRVPLSERAQLASLYDLPIPSPTGNVVPLAELGEFIKISQDPIYYQKDLRPIEYVVGDSVGRYNETTHEYSESAPIYGMLEIESLLTDYQTPDGVNLVQAGCTHKFYIIPICQRFLGPPEEYGRSGFEWTGEWTVTYETFRDMGLAFGAALILIYILVVWEFGNFIVPAIIMVPIPLTLLGIIPGHWLFDAEFTATSMIGWIALAGIIVRNSILLVDYSIHEIQQGSSIHDAVILACKTRTRPILITAFALVAGSTVILFDPIFQGMAISLLFGVLISTLLTLVVIPLGCISIGPEALGGNDNPPPPSSTVMSPQKPTPPPSSGTPLWLRIWGAIISVIIFIVTLIISLVQRLKAGIHAIISPPKPVAPKPQESKTQSQAPAASPSQLPVETDQPLSTTVAQTTPTVAEDKQTEKQPEDTKTTSEAQTTETPTTPLVSAETQKQITEDKADEAQSTQQQDSVPSATEKTAQQAEASTHDAQSPQHIPDVTAPQPAVTPSAEDEISKPTALDEEKTQQTENLS